MNKSHYVAAILLGAFVIAGAAGTIYAGDCPPAYYEVDHWELELVEVKVDGETVESEGEFKDVLFELENVTPTYRAR